MSGNPGIIDSRPAVKQLELNLERVEELIKDIARRVNRAEGKITSILPNPFAESLSQDINLFGAVKTFLEFDAYYDSTGVLGPTMLTPPTNVRYVWVDATDGHIKIRRDDGTDVDLETGTAAAASAQFLTLATDANIPNERVFTPGTALSGVDGGAGSTYTLNHAQASSGDLHTDYFLATGTRDITGAFDIDKAAGVLFTGSVSGSARARMQHDKLEFGTGGSMDVELARNASNQWVTPDEWIWTPSATQTLSLAGDAITIASVIKQIDNSTGASLTLTSTPTIADGVTGQMIIIVNVDSVDSVVLQDETALAGSNLRFRAATSLTLAAKESVMMTYNSAVGDWVQVL